jgi:hypothetical protein
MMTCAGKRFNHIDTSCDGFGGECTICGETSLELGQTVCHSFVDVYLDAFEGRMEKLKARDQE